MAPEQIIGAFYASQPENPLEIAALDPRKKVVRKLPDIRRRKGHEIFIRLADWRSGNPGIHLVLHGALLGGIDQSALAVDCIRGRFPTPPRRDFITRR